MYTKKYAGFWKRFAAFIIDQIILNVVQFIFFLPIAIYMLSEYIPFEDSGKSPDFVAIQYNYYDDFSLSRFIILMILFSVVSIVISWLYYSLFESSVKQATVGKMVLGIKVTDSEGNRISFLRASGRFFGKILSGMLLMVGYIMAGFTEKKQALHDIISNCLVVNTIYFEPTEFYKQTEYQNDMPII